MKFSIGDKVLLKRTGEEGVVTELISKTMIEVEVNGTTFPAYIDELEHPYLRWFTEQRAQEKKKTAPEQLPVERIIERKQRLAQGVYLSFIPVFKTDSMEEVVDFIKVHLVNELPVDVKYYYELKINHLTDFRLEGVIHNFGNIYLHNILYAVMNDQPRFHWSLVDTTNRNMQTAEGILRIRPVKLFEHVNDVMVNGQPSFSYLLIDDFVVAPPKPVPAKPFVPQSAGLTQPTLSILEPFRYEIDLHAEKLFSNPVGIAADVILKKQLDTLERYVHIAIAHRAEQMIVIHGLGKGKLKEAVHNYLKNVSSIARFKNEWSGKYGFGATEILFRY
jgi:hypothetical protein